MAFTQAQLLVKLRARLNETTEASWLDTVLKGIMDESAVQLCEDTRCLSAERTLSVIAYQPDYSLPANFIGIDTVQYREGGPLDQTDYDLWRECRGSTVRRVGTPSECLVVGNVLDAGGVGVLKIDPVPSSAARTTTLSGAVSSTSATSITVAATTSLPSQGTVIIDTEVIRYRNTSATQLLVCTRGAEGTTAATHSDAATVTERDIRIVHFVHPAAMSGTQDCQLPDRWIQGLVDLSTANALIQDGQMEKSRLYFTLYADRAMQTKRNSRRMFPRRTQYLRPGGQGRAPLNPIFRM